MDAAKPTGTVTFLFTDMEGSTRLWEEVPAKMRIALERHDALLSGIIAQCGGWTFKTVGDAFCVAFRNARDAVAAALEIQEALEHESFDLPRPLRVRIGIHTGEAHERDGDYFGPVVNRVARLHAVANGGQIVVSGVTHELVRDLHELRAAFHDLGSHRLKDLTRDERIFEVTRPDRAPDSPPIRTLDRFPNNLPSQATPLIGREEELAELQALVLDGETRLVTITGPGGMGKTRIAVQTAALVVEHFANGVFFADLSSARSDDDVIAACAALFAVGTEGSEPMLDGLVRYLSTKELLLVLDNFEQISECVRLVQALLRRAPEVRLLVTSRVSLNLRGERLFALEPLALPGRPPADLTVEQLSQYEAVSLFVARATAANRSFAVTRANAPVIAEICSQLDGIPLAIELAASRCRILEPEMILSRLADRLGFLRGGARDLPLRQRTLRSAVEWSYDLLTGEQQAAFAALSVFRGLIRLSAGERVIAALPTVSSDPLDLVQTLVEHSLLTAVPVAVNETTYAMLNVIRDFARERLDEAEIRVAVHDEHAAVQEELAHEYATRAQTAEHGTVTALLWSQLDNVLAAVEWLDECGEYARAHRILVLVRELFLSRGRAAELVTRLADLRRRGGAQIDEADHLITLGVASFMLSAPDDADRHLRAAAELLAPDDARQAELEYTLGRVASVSGRRAEARRHYDAAAALREADARSAIRAHQGVAIDLIIDGRVDEATEILASVVDDFDRLGDPRSAAQAAVNLGAARYHAGEHEEAVALFRRAATDLVAAGDVANGLLAYHNLATLLLHTGALGEARSVFGSMHNEARTHVMPNLEAMGLAGLALVRDEEGDSPGALELAGRAVAAARHSDSSDAAAYALRARADVEYRAGMLREALASYKAARARLNGAADPEEEHHIDERIRELAERVGERG